jgi:large subunit ribosomal protein L25
VSLLQHQPALDVDGKSEDVIIKDIQRHPAKALVLHMDFFRVSKTTKLQTRAPLHFINEDECVGVKLGGGLIAHSMTDIEISCLPKDLPEYIEVDMAEVELGSTVHLSDIKLPKAAFMRAAPTISPPAGSIPTCWRANAAVIIWARRFRSSRM